MNFFSYVARIHLYNTFFQNILIDKIYQQNWLETIYQIL